MICAGRKNFTSQLGLFSRNLITVAQFTNKLLYERLQSAFCVYSPDEGAVQTDGPYEQVLLMAVQILKNANY